MSISHTPGPWEVHNNSDWSVDTDSSNCFTHIGPRGDDPVAIAVVDHAFALDDILDANARLIAAAPELLSALVGIVTHWEACEQGPGHSHEVPGVWDSDNHPGLAGTRCEWCAQWSKARAAISKATSRQPEGER